MWQSLKNQLFTEFFYPHGSQVICHWDKTIIKITICHPFRVEVCVAEMWQLSKFSPLYYKLSALLKLRYGNHQYFSLQSVNLFGLRYMSLICNRCKEFGLVSKFSLWGNLLRMLLKFLFGAKIQGVTEIQGAQTLPSFFRSIFWKWNSML